MAGDYQVDLRADYPQRSSRGWAALTILLIKFLALIPHFFVLAFLGIAQAVVALVAQVVVAIKGEYPEGMFRFVAGVLRWNTRVTAFAFSLTDRYPPFALREVPGYAIDVKIERPSSSSRLYAVFTLLVEILVFAAMIGLFAWLADAAREWNSGSTYDPTEPWTATYQALPSGTSVLVLRTLAAVPHLIIVGVLGIATFVVWVVVQWIILFAASYPRGLWDFVVGVTRWRTRVTAYTLGLIDRYPPFTFEPSLSATSGAPPYVPGGLPPVAPAGPPPVASAGTQGASGPVVSSPAIEPPSAGPPASDSSASLPSAPGPGPSPAPPPPPI